MNYFWGIFLLLFVVSTAYYFINNLQSLTDLTNNIAKAGANLQIVQGIKKDFPKTNTSNEKLAANILPASNQSITEQSFLTVKKISNTDISLNINNSIADLKINNWLVRGDRGSYKFPSQPDIYLRPGEIFFIGVGEIFSANSQLEILDETLSRIY
jgi:hypothetical protein